LPQKFATKFCLTTMTDYYVTEFGAAEV